MMKVLFLWSMIFNVPLVANEIMSTEKSEMSNKVDLESKKDKEFADSPEIKEFEIIKNIIKSDLLEDEVKNKKETIINEKKETKRLHIEKFNYPSKFDFWTFMSELWLVKSAQKLNWDFEKPDYGLQESVKYLLQSFGHYEKKIKILLLKTPLVTHFALPADENEYIFLISLPFIRTMDLTKLEISMLVLEDFFRLNIGHFKAYVAEKELEKNLGRNFFGEKLNPDLLKKIMNNYDYFIFKKGFSFQQQYEVTQKMGNQLKSNLKLWSIYNNLLSKIDTLVKSNTLYSEYNKIYPSPELQLKWLNPVAKTL